MTETGCGRSTWAIFTTECMLRRSALLQEERGHAIILPLRTHRIYGSLDMRKYADLPFASTLCGSCSNVCPVKIDIHQQLYKWRQVIVKEGYAPAAKKIAMRGMTFTLSKPGMYALAGKAGRWVLGKAPFIVNNKFNPWYKQREMPEPPKASFGEWYKKNRKVE